MSQTTDRYNCRSAYPNSDLCRLFPPACVFSQLRFTWGGEFYDFLYQERELTIWYSMPFAKLTKKKQCKTDRLLILLWLGLYSDVFCMCCYFSNLLVELNLVLSVGQWLAFLHGQELQVCYEKYPAFLCETMFDIMRAASY